MDTNGIPPSTALAGLAGIYGPIKLPPITKALNPQMMRRAKPAIKTHCIHRLRNKTLRRMKAAAATIPNRGNATGPYVTASRFAAGNLCSMPMPWKMDPNFTAAKPSQQKAIRKKTARSHDSLRTWLAPWRFTANVADEP